MTIVDSIGRPQIQYASKVFGHDTEDWSFGAGLSIPLLDYVISADFAYADLGDLEKVQRVGVAIAGR